MQTQLLYCTLLFHQFQVTKLNKIQISISTNVSAMFQTLCSSDVCERDIEKLDALPIQPINIIV